MRLRKLLVAAVLVVAPAVGTATPAWACSAGYYKNVTGACVHTPAKAPRPPAGATAQCRDDSWSFSQHRSGTCSGHGGVARWL